MTGTVVEFDPVLRWGSILGADEVSYYVHAADVIGVRLAEGARVRFIAGYARRRPRAFDVVRLGEEDA